MPKSLGLIEDNSSATEMHSFILELIKSVNRKEAEFSQFNIGCAINEY